MKITPELLKKYVKGECTEVEKKFIEQWLPGDQDISAELSKKNVQKEVANMWATISADMDSGSKAIPLYRSKRLARYAAAACIILAAFFGGRLSSDPSDAPEMRVAQDINRNSIFQKDMLYITSNNAKPKKVSLENCEINFEGLIRLYSTAKHKKEIVCNGQLIALEPNKPYFIQESKSSGIRVVPNTPNNYDINKIENLETSFKVCV